MHYPENSYTIKDGKSEVIPPTWVPNEPFNAMLELQTSQRGRSAAYFMWADTVMNKKYPMFMADMLELILHKTLVKGVVIAQWQVRKRGQNYGIALAANVD